MIRATSTDAVTGRKVLYIGLTHADVDRQEDKMKLTVTDAQRIRFSAPLEEVPGAMARRGLRDGMTWAQAAAALGSTAKDDIGCIVAITAAVAEEEYKC